MNKNTVPVICLDGPSGVGKGTICLAVAKKLGWHILDSGSLYRLTALKVSREFPDTNVDSIKDSQLYKIAINLLVRYVEKNNSLAIFLDGEAVNDLIRNEEIGAKASIIAAIPKVREALLARQRAFLQMPGLVADGRDMGSVVFPDSALKIYLTASPEERAQRRYKQLKEKGIDAILPSLVEDLRVRDERDMNRKTAPLKPASDAIIIDTSKLSIEQVIAKVMLLVDQQIYTK